MQAELDGTVRVVTRNRRGVMWCPFCDRSTQNLGGDQYCEGCHAKFTDDAVEEAPVVVAPRRRGRPPQAPAEEQAEVDNADFASDDEAE